MGKGQDKERDFVNEWQAKSERHDAFRLAASGGGKQSELPDIQLTDGYNTYVQEQKYAGRGQSRTAPIKFTEQEDLLTFAWRWGFIPLFIFRFSDDTTWYVMEPFSELYYQELTPSYYIYGKRNMRDEYTTLQEYFDNE